MLDVKISGSVIGGTVSAIPSKSYAHRIAICNYLANNTKLLDDRDEYPSNDITVTKNCLTALQNGGNVLDCGESGSTLRFVIPLALVKGGEYTFIGHGKLMDRPNDALIECLRGHGVEIVSGADSITAKGKLTAGVYTIRGDVSSQYISGLLMALSAIEGESRLELTTPLASAPYVDITIDILSSYGVGVERLADGYIVKGTSTFKGNCRAEGDWSNSAFFLVLGAILGDISLTGLNLKSKQGDRVILDILERAGVAVDARDDKITVKESAIQPFTMDATDCPDLVPIVSVLAAFAKGESTITNVERLRLKESDRIASTIAMLGGFGIEAECKDDAIVIRGGNPRAGRVDSYNDHRIAMSSTIMALCLAGESTITNYQAIDKSYPTFLEDIKSIGGIAYEL